MFVDIYDLITEQFYIINIQSIRCFTNFTKQEDKIKYKIYHIILNDGTKISTSYKKQIEIMNKLAKDGDKNNENKY